MKFKYPKLIFSLMLLYLLQSCGGTVSGNTKPTEGSRVSFKLTESTFHDIDLTPGINTGTIEIIINQSDAVQLNYTIFVPQISDDERVPLVFGLHGRGQPADHLVRDYLTPSIGDLGGIIFGYDAPEDSDWLDGVSVSLTKQLLDLAVANWPVDENKLVLTGYSMGGTGTWNIMTKFAHMFSAAIPIASTPQPWVEHPTAKIPLYVIHPENDTFFPLEDIQEAVTSLEARGANITFVVVPGIQHHHIYNTIPYLTETIEWLETQVWK